MVEKKTEDEVKINKEASKTSEPQQNLAACAESNEEEDIEKEIERELAR